jgi:hypothetical protein
MRHFFIRKQTIFDYFLLKRGLFGRKQTYFSFFLGNNKRLISFSKK